MAAGVVRCGLPAAAIALLAAGCSQQGEAKQAPVVASATILAEALAALEATTVPVPTPALTATRTPVPPPRLRAVSLKLDCRPHSFPQRTQQSFAVDPTDDRKLYIGVEQEG